MKDALLKILSDVTEGAYSREELLYDDYEDKGMLDSLQIVELVVELEDIFGIEINDEDLSIDNMRSFEMIIDLIQRLRK